jgi:hypothetical protein
VRAGRPKLILKPPVPWWELWQLRKNQNHANITERQCSVALDSKREKEKSSPHCMKDLDVIQTLYQETGQVQSNHKLEYRLKKNQTARSKRKLRQDYIF